MAKRSARRRVRSEDPSVRKAERIFHRGGDADSVRAMKGFALEQGTAARANRITPGAGKLHRDFVGAEKVVQAVQVARAETSGADARHAFPVRRYAHTRHLFGIRACAEEGGARGIRSEIGRSAVASSRDRAAPDAAKPLVADRPEATNGSSKIPKKTGFVSHQPLRLCRQSSGEAGLEQQKASAAHWISVRRLHASVAGTLFLLGSLPASKILPPVPDPPTGAPPIGSLPPDPNDPPGRAPVPPAPPLGVHIAPEHPAKPPVSTFERPPVATFERPPVPPSISLPFAPPLSPVVPRRVAPPHAPAPIAESAITHENKSSRRLKT
jgi:hypothetical protein